jgi:hypothetical protein
MPHMRRSCVAVPRDNHDRTARGLQQPRGDASEQNGAGRPVASGTDDPQARPRPLGDSAARTVRGRTAAPARRRARRRKRPRVRSRPRTGRTPRCRSAACRSRCAPRTVALARSWAPLARNRRVSATETCRRSQRAHALMGSARSLGFRRRRRACRAPPGRCLRQRGRQPRRPPEGTPDRRDKGCAAGNSRAAGRGPAALVHSRARRSEPRIATCRAGLRTASRRSAFRHASRCAGSIEDPRRSR